MITFFRSLPHGTGGATWLFYVLLMGLAVFVFAPDASLGLVSVLAGIFSAIRLELNQLKARIEQLEAEPGAPLA